MNNVIPLCRLEEQCSFMTMHYPTRHIYEQISWTTTVSTSCNGLCCFPRHQPQRAGLVKLENETSTQWKTCRNSDHLFETLNYEMISLLLHQVINPLYASQDKYGYVSQWWPHQILIFSFKRVKFCCTFCQMSCKLNESFCNWAFQSAFLMYFSISPFVSSWN